jgi:MFS family permease
LLGPYIDHYGRRRGLILTLGLMAVGTLAISVVPGFRTIGYVAPILVVCGRLVQGLSAGVEFGGVSVYLAEIATPGHRGFFVSFQSVSVQVAVIVSALFGMAVNRLLPPETMTDWGWRVPLWIGCAIIPLLFLLRRSLQETEEFAARTRHPSIGEIWRSLLGSWRLVLTGVFLVSLSNASFYMITTYTPTFGKSVLHLSEGDALLVTCCVGLSNLLLVPLAGALSDRVGRRPVLLLSTVAMVLLAYPAMTFLIGAPSFGHLLAVELVLSLIYSAYNGALIVFVTEIMPFEVRTAGFSLAYSVSQALFGGFTPLICTWLIHATRDKAVPGAWLSMVALLAMAGLFFCRRRQKSLDLVTGLSA